MRSSQDEASDGLEPKPFHGSIQEAYIPSDRSNSTTKNAHFMGGYPKGHLEPTEFKSVNLIGPYAGSIFRNVDIVVRYKRGYGQFSFLTFPHFCEAPPNS